jgi:hypothetical protein
VNRFEGEDWVKQHVIELWLKLQKDIGDYDWKRICLHYFLQFVHSLHCGLVDINSLAGYRKSVACSNKWIKLSHTGRALRKREICNGFFILTTKLLNNFYWDTNGCATDYNLYFFKLNVTIVTSPQ